MLKFDELTCKNTVIESTKKITHNDQNILLIFFKDN